MEVTARYARGTPPEFNINQEPFTASVKMPCAVRDAMSAKMNKGGIEKKQLHKGEGYRS